MLSEQEAIAERNSLIDSLSLEDKIAYCIPPYVSCDEDYEYFSKMRDVIVTHPTMPYTVVVRLCNRYFRRHYPDNGLIPQMKLLASTLFTMFYGS